MADLVFTANPGSLPASYVLGPSEALAIESVRAKIDGTSASGTFIPCLSIYSQDGKLLARVPTSEAYNAGDSGEVTWSPFLGRGGNVGTGSAIVLLYDSGVLSGSQASFDYASIPQTYSHLWMIATLRSDAVLVGTSGDLTVNGDTGANYEDSIFQQSGGGVSATNTNGRTAMRVFDALGASAEAGHYSTNQVIAYAYSQSIKDHAFHGTDFHIGTAATTSTYYSAIRGGQYCIGAATAISELTLKPSAGSNWVAGSSFRVYGIP